MEEGFVLKVNLDFTQATAQFRKWAKAREAEAMRPGAAGVSGVRVAPAAGTGAGDFAAFSRSVRTATRLFDRLNASLARLSTGRGVSSVAAGPVAAGGISRPVAAAMALPGAAMLGALALSPIKSVLGTGYSTLVGNQKLATDLGTLLGDDRAGEAFAGRIRAYAGATPYSQRDLAGTAKMLVQYGAGVEETEKYMRQLGDVALGSSQQMQSLGLVLAQVRSQGKLMGQDLMQFINAGFNPLSEISRTTGRSMAELRDDMSKGKISFEMVAEALGTATAEGGKFYRGAERGAKTLGGLMSTFRDNFEQAMASAVERNMPKLEGLLRMWTTYDWGPAVDAVAMISSGLVEGLKGVSSAVQFATSNAQMLRGAINSAAVAAGALAAVKLYKWFDAVTASSKAAAASSGGLAGSLSKSRLAFNSLAAAAVWASGQIVEAGKALYAYLGERSKEAARAQGGVEHSADYAALQARRREWKEAERAAGGSSDPRAREYVSRARAAYEAAARKVEGGYGEGVAGGGVTDIMRRELGWKTSAEASASRAAKGGVASFSNVGNTYNQVTNNIETSTRDLADVIRQVVDDVMTSRLTIRTNLEQMKVVNT